MANQELIPLENIELRAIERVPDVRSNYYIVEADDWVEKPRMTVQIKKDGTPAYVKRISISSGSDQADNFKIKYKVRPDEDAWRSYDDESGTNTVSFTMVLEITSKRISKHSS